MNSLLSKLRSRSDPACASKIGSVGQDGISHEENTLADEQDAVTESLSGTLQLSDELMKTPTDPNKDFNYIVPCEGSSPTRSNVTFEVISAEVVREGRSGHVNYSVLINPHWESSKGNETVIIRRYSDFENLHQRLKKRFPSIMSQISFPRKILTGNLTSSTIAKRSTAFEQYLTHIFSQFDLRYSQEFMEFFVQEDFHDAVQLFLACDFTKAAELFEQILPILDKLYGDSHPHVFHCLCALVVSYIRVDRTQVALTCTEAALKCSGSANDEFIISLLQTAVRLSWTLGKDKGDLEKRLEALKAQGDQRNGVKSSSVRDLCDLVTEAFRLRLRH
ncbi:sorting nexin-21-like [Plakobranchus ocellatus]|uniref:Sorting nexin-21-like n=1 Tax=Plakobranchus ocellatus TaxID=259542 RepID=A0AAV4DH98_9GAST|nr:sorting nexin-21-like [Plakobranchus ocellatus]